MNIRPYGDTSNDGKVQLSFTLPVKAGAKGIECAKEFARQMGMIDPNVVHCEPMGEVFSMYVVYGRTPFLVDPDRIAVSELETPALSMEEVERLIEEKLGRDVVFVGASTGTDAHTVGIDAIMNMKGYAGHYGLERYRHVKTCNMGSQVSNEAFVKKARELKADVLLVSQTVTQKDVHLANMVELVELLEAEKMRDDVILIAGGARITHELAKELGYDAGFGPKKYAEDVATYAVLELIRRKDRG
ncbi:MAG: OAM dimerization domain-containing protein [Candidatus Izemoplasmatales bacterium]